MHHSVGIGSDGGVGRGGTTARVRGLSVLIAVSWCELVSRTGRGRGGWTRRRGATVWAWCARSGWLTDRGGGVHPRRVVDRQHVAVGQRPGNWMSCDNARLRPMPSSPNRTHLPTSRPISAIRSRCFPLSPPSVVPIEMAPYPSCDVMLSAGREASSGSVSEG